MSGKFQISSHKLMLFKSFYQQYDKRRGYSLKDTFPKILSEWVESITIDDTIPIVNLGTGEIINHDS